MVFTAIFGLIVILLFSCIKIVSQTDAYVVERLGKYSHTMNAGINFKVPIIDRIVRRVKLKEQIGDFPPQPVITKDNVSIQVDTAIYYKIFDPKLFTYGVENAVEAMALLTATTMRNIIGGMDLDDTLTSRDQINSEMLTILDEATDQWGIKVTRVEIKNIIPPRDIQDAMEKQMKAERTRRETVLEAESHKQAVTMRAEGDKQATVLKAEAERDAAIARAQGEAESIRLVYEAEANGIKALANAGLTREVITLKKLEALKELGKGQATKIVIPTELAGAASDLTIKGELLDIADKAVITPEAETPVKPDDCCVDESRTQVTHDLTGMTKEEREQRMQELRAKHGLTNE